MVKTTFVLALSFLLLTACESTAVKETSQVRSQVHSDQPFTDIDGSDKQTGHTRHQSWDENTLYVEHEDKIVKEADPNIWQRIADGLVIPRDINNRAVKARMKFYANNQDYLDRIAERAAPYIYHIVEELQRRDMPLDLALLPVVESAYQPFAYSRSHASGIWQFIPSTGRHYGLKQNWWYDGRRDIVAATDAALNYLEKLNREFNGDWLLALAAYNAGERRIAREIQKNKRNGKPSDFWSLRLPRETRGYVPSLIAIAEIVSDPVKYQVTLEEIPNEQYFEIVDAGGQIDLATVSELTGMGMEEIYTLNPGINKWATDPDGPHYLLIPLHHVDTFRQALANLPDEERIKWQRYEVKHGDTLGHIAYRYRTNLRTLKRINKLRGNTIRIGQNLMIPTSKKPMDEYTLSYDARMYRGLKRTGDGKRLIYTIRRGDTLWDISRDYDVTVRQLCAWNGIHPRTILRPGNELVVWSKEIPKARAMPVAATTGTVVTADSGHISYTVKTGDSLWLIARRHGVTVNQLQKWNSLNKRTLLKPGQSLDIYLGQAPTDA